MKIGIVLSGGGIRGIAHLGVLKALKNVGLTFSHISGTSAGAIAGAFVANGIDPWDAFKIFEETKLWKFVRPALGSLGLINIERTADLLTSVLKGQTFDSLDTPLTIAAVNFSQGKLVYFTEGSLIPAVLASSCIPGIFRPITINGNMYVDGGVLNNFPVEPLLGKYDFIIGSSCNHLNPVDRITGITKLMARAGTMSVNHDMERKATLCDVLIEPKGLGDIHTFDMKQAETVYWLAYEETLKAIKNNEKLTGIISQSRISDNI